MANPSRNRFSRASGDVGAKSREIRSGVEPLPWATVFEGSNPTLSANQATKTLILLMSAASAGLYPPFYLQRGGHRSPLAAGKLRGCRTLAGQGVP
jgi:hypothetical protein